MNKKLITYFSKYDLEFSKNYAYGKIKGYEVNIFYQALDNVSPVKMFISFYASENDKIQIGNEIANEKIKFLQYQLNGFGLLLGLNDYTVNGLVKKLDDILDKVFSIITNNNAKGVGYCPMCGEELDEASKVYRVNDCKFRLHLDCGKELSEAFDEEYEEYKELPNNYGKGFLGALIGAAVGVGSYIIIFFLGFVSSISSFISVLLGSFLYKKFGGKPNFMMIVMTTVLTIASLLLTVYLIYCLAALGYCYELNIVDVTNMSIFEAFKYAMEEVEFSKEFTSNMSMTLLFTLLGAGYETYSLYKGMYKKQQIK